MKKATKSGLILASIHTLLWIAIVLSDLLGANNLDRYIGNVAIALDAPVYIGLSYIYQILDLAGWYEDLLLVLLVVVVGPAWLFMIGQSLSMVHEWTRTFNGAALLGVTCALTFAGYLYAAASQLAVTSHYILWGGCGYAGFPLEFLRDCGSLRLTFSFANFAANSVIWTVAGVILGLSFQIPVFLRNQTENQTSE